MPQEENRRAAVYRLYDETGRLLYIGSAYDPQERTKKHRAKSWWSQVARSEVEWRPSRQAAYISETDAIAAERPTFNRISGPGAVASPALRPRTSAAVADLGKIDDYLASLRDEPPTVRARALTELLATVRQAVRARRRPVVLEMQAAGMSYRQIADAAGISFGRVRQIIADEPESGEATDG